jgi:cytidyltransferase-like protein
MTYVHNFESFLNEAVVTEITKGKRVVFFPGRFQPFHNGHLEALRRTSQEFGLPVIPLQILSKKEESPFPDTLLKRIGADIVKSNSFIADYFIYPQTYGKTVIPFFVRYLREEGYEPLGLGCGSDRLKDYNSQVAYITGPKTDTVVEPEFTVKMVDARDSDGASGTRVRGALRNDDQKSFENMMPRELWKYYDELRKYIK